MNFSKSRPKLGNPDIISQIKVEPVPASNNKTILDYMSDNLSNIYHGYVKENKLFLFLVFCILCFLYMRYEMKQKKEKFLAEIRHQKADSDLNCIIQSQTDHLEYNHQPTYNPLTPINEVEDKINYPPHKLPLRTGRTCRKIEMVRSIDESPQHFQTLNSPNIVHTDLFEKPTINYYIGDGNTYKNAQDTEIDHPWGWPTNFNTSTGNFMEYATFQNEMNLQEYDKYAQHKRDEVVNSIQIGPDMIDMSIPYNYVMPPYAV